MPDRKGVRPLLHSEAPTCAVFLSAPFSASNPCSCSALALYLHNSIRSVAASRQCAVWRHSQANRQVPPECACQQRTQVHILALLCCNTSCA